MRYEPWHDLVGVVAKATSGSEFVGAGIVLLLSARISFVSTIIICNDSTRLVSLNFPARCPLFQQAGR